MRGSHALIPLREHILVYWLPFLLWQFFHYSVWVISEPNYEKFLILGRDSLFAEIIFIIKISKNFQEFYLWIPNERLKWYGIKPLEETEAKKLNGMYGDDCKCEFKCEFKCTCCQFKCSCGWNKTITLKEHKSFQDLRILSKSGI